MKHGDFSTLAKHYHSRAGYSDTVVDMLYAYTVGGRTDALVADIGAGTGKFTECLVTAGLGVVVAVEPNDDMRSEGAAHTSHLPIDWRTGSAEDTGLEANGYAWITMASSFHWANPDQALPEFHRVLDYDGFLTVLWNPRDLERSDLHSRIEGRIYDLVPGIQRMSSGFARHMHGVQGTLVSTGHFTDVVFVEADHEVRMSPERYLDVWRSVNDIQVQAGPERFQSILAAIEEEIAGLQEVVVPYQTRSWTARRVG